jgi:hypothetical protein
LASSPDAALQSAVFNMPSPATALMAVKSVGKSGGDTAQFQRQMTVQAGESCFERVQSAAIANLAPLVSQHKEAMMSDIEGVSIIEVTAFGSSDDGRHIWISHRLRDGSEYRLVYPYVAAGQLITMITHAARSAYAGRARRNPGEVTAGMDTAIIPVAEVRVAPSPEKSKAIVHLTTTDNVPIAVEMPLALLAELAEQSQRVLESLREGPSESGFVH